MEVAKGKQNKKSEHLSILKLGQAPCYPTWLWPQIGHPQTNTPALNSGTDSVIIHEDGFVVCDWTSGVRHVELLVNQTHRKHTQTFSWLLQGALLLKWCTWFSCRLQVPSSGRQSLGASGQPITGESTDSLALDSHSGSGASSSSLSRRFNHYSDHRLPLNTFPLESHQEGGSLTLLQSSV